VLTKRCGNA